MYKGFYSLLHGYFVFTYIFYYLSNFIGYVRSIQCHKFRSKFKNSNLFLFKIQFYFFVFIYRQHIYVLLFFMFQVRNAVQSSPTHTLYNALLIRKLYIL